MHSITRISLIVFLLSIALLGFELSLMRMLSYAQWHHFAYMIISIALLGFGASGSVLSFFHLFLGSRKELTLSLGTLLCVLSLALSPFLFSFVPIDPFLLISEPIRVWQLGLFCLIAFLPFFFGALVIALSFSMSPDHVGRLYFFNMAGSGIGSLGTVLVMNWVHPNFLPLLMVLITLPAVWLATANFRSLQAKIAAITGACLALVLALFAPRFEMSQFKGLSKQLLLPDVKILQSMFNPLGVLEVVQSPAIRYAPGLSLAFPGPIPSTVDVFLDGERVGSIADACDSSWLRSLDYSVFSLPYQFLQHPHVLVVGAGTGDDIQMANYFGAQHVTALEMNKGMIELLKQDYRERTNNIGSQKQIFIVQAEARSFLARDWNQYDLIVVPILDGMTASAAGTQALFENYLFTVESFSAMLQRLSVRGILMTSTWMTFPPRSSMKMISNIVESLRQSGIANPGDHIAAVRTWSTVTILAKKEPWTTQEVGSVRGFCERLSFDLIYVPGIQIDETNKYNRLEPDHLYESTQAMLRRDSHYFENYPFQVGPATDDRPYFGHFFKWKSLPFLQEAYGLTRSAFFELGYFFLLLTLVQLIVVSFVLIILPILAGTGIRESRRGLWNGLVYFGGIGLGYMFVEVVMIQKFILFLGHPIYSVSAIITIMLVFSGIGSYFSSTLGAERTHVVFIGILAILLTYAAALSPLLRFLLPLEFAWRLASCVLLIAPLAFLMGFPFPTGLSHVSPQMIPWSWGINGYFSVISASLVTLVAMEIGFSAVFGFSVLAYGTAAWARSRLWQVSSFRPKTG